MICPYWKRSRGLTKKKCNCEGTWQLRDNLEKIKAARKEKDDVKDVSLCKG